LELLDLDNHSKLKTAKKTHTMGLCFTKDDALLNACSKVDCPDMKKVASLLAKTTDNGPLSEHFQIFERDEKGMTAMMWACFHGHKEPFKAIIACDNTGKYGLKRYTQRADHNGMTALMHCIRSQSMHAEELIAMLIQKDPSPKHLNMKNKNGNTALTMAMNYSHSDDSPKKIWDEENKLFYYVTKKTGEVTWEKPICKLLIDAGAKKEVCVWSALRFCLRCVLTFFW